MVTVTDDEVVEGTEKLIEKICDAIDKIADGHDTAVVMTALNGAVYYLIASQVESPKALEQAITIFKNGLDAYRELAESGKIRTNIGPTKDTGLN